MRSVGSFVFRCFLLVLLILIVDRQNAASSPLDPDKTAVLSGRVIGRRSGVSVQKIMLEQSGLNEFPGKGYQIQISERDADGRTQLFLSYPGQSASFVADFSIKGKVRFVPTQKVSPPQADSAELIRLARHYTEPLMLLSSGFGVSVFGVDEERLVLGSSRFPYRMGNSFYADFNGDGATDAIILGEGTPSALFSSPLGDVPEEHPIPGFLEALGDARILAAGDVDGDGRAELLAATEEMFFLLKIEPEAAQCTDLSVNLCGSPILLDKEGGFRAELTLGRTCVLRIHSEECALSRHAYALTPYRPMVDSVLIFSLPKGELNRRAPATSSVFGDDGPLSCIGFVGFKNDISAWGARHECPPGFAIVETGFYREHDIVSCCPLSKGVLREDSDPWWQAADSCPEDAIATGVRKRSESLLEDCEACQYALRCHSIDTERFKLNPAGGRYYGNGHSMELGGRALFRNDIPLSLRLGAGRRGFSFWSSQGCIGYPWGALYSGGHSKSCTELDFRILTPKTGDSPSVSYPFAECRTLPKGFDPLSGCEVDRQADSTSGNSKKLPVPVDAVTPPFPWPLLRQIERRPPVSWLLQAVEAGTMTMDQAVEELFRVEFETEIGQLNSSALIDVFYRIFAARPPSIHERESFSKEAQQAEAFVSSFVQSDTFRSWRSERINLLLLGKRRPALRIDPNLPKSVSDLEAETASRVLLSREFAEVSRFSPSTFVRRLAEAGILRTPIRRLPFERQAAERFGSFEAAKSELVQEALKDSRGLRLAAMLIAFKQAHEHHSKVDQTAREGTHTSFSVRRCPSASGPFQKNSSSLGVLRGRNSNGRSDAGNSGTKSVESRAAQWNEIIVSYLKSTFFPDVSEHIPARALERLFLGFFGRKPHEGELDALAARESEPMETFLRRFILSPVFFEWRYDRLSRRFLGHGIETEDLSSCLSDYEIDERWIALEISESPEALSLAGDTPEGFVQYLYGAALNRNGSETELSWHVQPRGVLGADTLNELQAQLAAAVVLSPEAERNYLQSLLLDIEIAARKAHQYLALPTGSPAAER